MSQRRDLSSQAKRRRAAGPVEWVPCPHCGADVRADAAACRQCGYDWPEVMDDDQAFEDDFDYDDYVDREFSNSRVSTTLKPWQRAMVFVLVAGFALAMLWQFL